MTIGLRSRVFEIDGKVGELKVRLEGLHAQQEVMNTPHWVKFVQVMAQKIDALAAASLNPSKDEASNGALLQYQAGHRAGQASVLRLIVETRDNIQKKIDEVDKEISAMKAEAREMARAVVR